MIEACVDLRNGTNGEVGYKKRGDVLVVKLPGSPWGSDCEKIHQIVEWDDPALEAKLLAQQKAGQETPKITSPYTTYDADGNIITRSTEFMDVDDLPPGNNGKGKGRGHMMDRTNRVPKLKKNEFKRKTRS